MSTAGDAQPFPPGRQLYEAAAAGDAAAVASLVDQGEADVMWADEEGTTALMKAAENGHQEVVQLLLDGGAPWNQQDNDGYCAGEYATVSRNQAIVELIMEWGVQAEMALMAAERWAWGNWRAGQALDSQGAAAGAPLLDTGPCHTTFCPCFTGMQQQRRAPLAAKSPPAMQATSVRSWCTHRRGTSCWTQMVGALLVHITAVTPDRWSHSDAHSSSCNFQNSAPAH